MRQCTGSVPLKCATLESNCLDAPPYFAPLFITSPCPLCFACLQACCVWYRSFEKVNIRVCCFVILSSVYASKQTDCVILCGMGLRKKKTLKLVNHDLFFQAHIGKKMWKEEKLFYKSKSKLITVESSSRGLRRQAPERRQLLHNSNESFAFLTFFLYFCRQ